MRILSVFIFIALVSCNSGRTLDITKEEIISYVDVCLDTSQIYDIATGPRFSRDDESYQVTEYSQYDSIKLYAIEEFSAMQTFSSLVFYKEDLPVYIEEYISDYGENTSSFTERKIYLNGRDIIAAEERVASSEFELENKAFKDVEVDVDRYDFGKPKESLDQSGQFAMQFKEFLIINPESYLILTNAESNYSVALYIIEGDEMLDKMYSEPLVYKNKTIYFEYEIKTMGGIERLIYRGAKVVEQKD